MTECTCGATLKYWQSHPTDRDPSEVVHDMNCQVVQKALYEETNDL